MYSRVSLPFMADTDDTSKAFANEARTASNAVSRDIENLVQDALGKRQFAGSRYQKDVRVPRRGAGVLPSWAPEAPFRPGDAPDSRLRMMWYFE